MNTLNMSQERIGNRDVLASILLSERPPGTAGTAWALGAVVLAMLWLTAFVGDKQFATSNTDVAVVALGVPGLIALWLQDVIGGQAKAHVTALTKCLLWLSAASSLAGVAYITWRSLYGSDTHFRWWAILVCTRWVFAGLGLLLGVSLVLQTVRLIRDTREYRKRLRLGIDNTAVITNA